MEGYRQFCGVARALDVVGDRWTLLIVRDLLLGPRRYSDLQRSLGSISPSVLSRRLQHLVEFEIVRRHEGQCYTLTPSGKDLERVVLALGTFGARYLDEPRPDDRLDPRWAMLALKRRFSGARGSGTVGLFVGSETFTARFVQNSIDVWDGAGEALDATIEGDSSAWFDLLSGRARLGALLGRKAIRLSEPRAPAVALLRGLGVDVRSLPRAKSSTEQV